MNPVGQLIGDVVCCGRDRSRQPSSRKAASHQCPPAERVIGVRKIAQHIGVELVGYPGHARVIVIRVRHVDTVTQGQGRTAVGIVIVEADGGRSLGDLGQPVSIVIRICDLGLAGDGHAGAAARQVITVRNCTLRRGLRGQAIQIVIRLGDRSAGAVNRLRHAGAGVVENPGATADCPDPNLLRPSK